MNMVSLCCFCFCLFFCFFCCIWFTQFVCDSIKYREILSVFRFQEILTNFLQPVLRLVIAFYFNSSICFWLVLHLCFYLHCKECDSKQNGTNVEYMMKSHKIDFQPAKLMRWFFCWGTIWIAKKNRVHGKDLMNEEYSTFIHEFRLSAYKMHAHKTPQTPLHLTDDHHSLFSLALWYVTERFIMSCHFVFWLLRIHVQCILLKCVIFPNTH